MRPTTWSGARPIVLASFVGVGTIVAPASAGPAPASAGPAPASSSRQAPREPSVVAKAMTSSVPVFDEPGAAAPSRVLANPTITDGELVFLVDQVREGWLQVLLPVKPNGSTGWIQASDVALSSNPYRIVVDLERHRLSVFDGKRRVLRKPVGIGTEQTPTPKGRYYVTQLFEPPNPDGPYGPYAYSLSGFSEVLETFQGGDAIIGIHGTNRPDLVGKDVSHGCIRLRNPAVTRLAALLPLGTPVAIKGRP
jgi:lipoprotein-anchoring transpeptidase ErfK/SrfK